MSLGERTFICKCGVSEDRDIHAAKNMVWIYKNLVGRDAAEFTLKEFRTSVAGHRFDVCHESMDDDLRRCSVFS